jgi:hypothetical protein
VEFPDLRPAIFFRDKWPGAHHFGVFEANEMIKAGEDEEMI